MTDKQSLVLKNIQNFMKMYSEETCELIKINYWNALENAIIKSSLESKEVNNLIFQEILNKTLVIVNDKNLTFLILNFCLNKSTENSNMEDADAFFCGVYELFDKLLQNYDKIMPFVKDYILEYSVNLLLELSPEKFDFSDNRRSFKIIFKYFSDFLEIDFLYLSAYLLSISNQIDSLIKNNVFQFFFKKYLKFLFEENYFSNIIYFLNCLTNSTMLSNAEKVNLICTFIQLSVNPNQPQEGGSLVFDDMQKIFYFELLKKAHLFILDHLKVKKEDEINLAFYEILENFLLFLFENSKIFSGLILENHGIICFLSGLKFNNKYLFPKFNKVFPISVLNLLNRVNTFSSLENLAKICQDLKQNNNNIKAKFIIKIVQKCLALNGKLKGFPKAELFNVENLKIRRVKKSNDVERINLDFAYKTDALNNLNISYLNLMGFVIEKTLTEKDNSIYFDENLFCKFLEILLSLNFENFDLQLKTDLVRNLIFLLFVIYEALEDGLDLLNANTKNIFEVFFYFLRTRTEQDFSINEIYPVLISFFQVLLFPKIQASFKRINNKTSIAKDNLNVLNQYFEFIISLARIDSIANIISKFLISILNAKDLNLTIKLFALEKFNNLIISINTGKLYIVYFNHVSDMIKKLSINNPPAGNPEESQKLIQENIEIKNAYLYSLWDLAARYNGNLPFEFIKYFTAKFEECLNKLPDESITFEHLVAVEAINFIIIKDQNEALIESILENVLNMKFMKIFDKLFQKAKSLESNLIKYVEYFRIDDNKFNNYNISLNVLFSKQGLDLTLCLNDPDFMYLLIVVFLARLFSGFLSNLILHNKEKFNLKTFSDKSNVAITSIMKTFDYISASVIFLKDENKSFSHLLFINEIFSQAENLNFFNNTHSYLTAMENIEKNNLDYSMLNESNIKIISEKNKNLFFYTRYNDKGIFYLKKTVLNLIAFEINSYTLMDSKHHVNNHNHAAASNILSSIYLDSLKSYLFMNHKNNKSIASFYIRFLFDALQNVSEIKTVFNKNLCYFLLTERVFENLFKNCADLLNVDIINVCLYNLLLSSNPLQLMMDSNSQLYGHIQENILQKTTFVKSCFLDYLIKYAKISKNSLQFSLRLLGNPITFSKLMIPNQDNLLEISDKLFTLIDSVISIVLFFNSYNIESYTNIYNVLENIKNVSNLNYSCLANLMSLGKMISNLYVCITAKQKMDGLQTEINKKLKDQLLLLLNGEYLLYYLEILFDIKNQKFIDSVKNDYEKFYENVLIFKNFKKIKLIKENNNESPQLKKLEESEMFKILFLITDLTIPTYLHNSIMTLIRCYLNSDENMKFLIENFLYFNLTFQTKKPIIDMMKNLIFNPHHELVEFNDQFGWKQKYGILNLLIYFYISEENLIKSIKRKDFFDWRKLEIIKNLIGYLHFNIFLRSDLKSYVFERFNSELMKRLDDDTKDYLNKLNINLD